jgi:hypothetical protein
MTLRHLVTLIAALAAVATLAPVAVADPQPLERIQQQADDRQPDGFQPQLRRSAGAASHPDNASRPQVARGRVEADAAAPGGFDWSDAAIGLGAGLMLAAVAAVVVAAGMTRTRLAHP